MRFLTHLKRAAAFAFMACLSIGLQAQISAGGTPLSLQHDKIDWDIPQMTMPDFDQQAMLNEDAINHASKDTPYRFGKNFVLGRNLNNAGNWHDLPNGDRLWLLKVKSPGAYSLNLSFDMFQLPEGGRLYVYSPDGEHILGAYTSANNNENMGLGTYPVPGDELIIEYYEPSAQMGNSLLQIETVTHAYRDLNKVMRGIGDSGACNNNVICPEGAPWTDQINSVAMIVVNGNGICTGALVNNTANDGYPYFLTANHCLGGSVSSWVFRFNWQSTTCGSNNVGSFDTVNGSNLLANGDIADYALLEINNGNPVPTAFNPYYAGWDATGDTPSNSTAIHHPSGDLKKISFDNDPAGQGNFGNALCWQIFDWEDGTTEPGSSGSPLFDQNQRIIGQLFGGQASCANNINDYYGRFDITYPNVCQWLAPGCNTLVLDGYDPNTPTVADNAQLLSVDEPSGAYCQASVTPQITIRNAGTNSISSLTIEYGVQGGATQSFNWSGSLAPGGTEVVSLGAIAPGGGNFVFEVELLNPNGTADGDPSNNTGTSSFSLNPAGVIVDFTLTTDNYPGETTWEITDGGGNVLFSDGPYADTQTTYDYAFCLADGCYTLTVFDSFGDGMQYQGVEGSYLLTDQNGVVLAEIVAGADFGNQAVHNFCVSSGANPGCTDPTACNFDPGADADDGSCTFPGCTNPAACNFDPAAGCDDGSCDLPDGCTDPAACNFDPAASCDDGSCILPDGCTDPTACNFDANASCDDGSCEFPPPGFDCNCDNVLAENTSLTGSNSTVIDVNGTGSLSAVDVNLNWTNSNGDSSWPADLAISVTDPNGNCIEWGGFNLTIGCTSLGNYTLWPASWENGASGVYTASIDVSTAGLTGDGNWSVTILNGWNNSSGVIYDIELTLNSVCLATDIPGCTNPAACNFDPAATSDDGSCQLPDGCTDPAACNYDPAATCDDGSCQLPDGCTDPAACNYDPAAQCDDASCAFAQIYYADTDGDGFGAGAPVDLCSPQAGFVQNNTDCDDSNSAAYPGAPGTGEGIDNDCNGLVEGNEEAPMCMGDLNNDGFRDVSDLLLMLSGFGCAGDCATDLTDDGQTNSADFLLFLSIFGTDCP